MNEEKETRKNAFLIIVSQTASKLGDVLGDAKTVLTWLMGVVGAPGVLTGMLVPVRESGSMLPQVFISGWVKRVRRRKWVYVAGAAGQAASLAAMGLSAIFLKGTAAGVAIVAALGLLALARCLSSIASKDVLGKAVPKGKRGKVGGAATAISGALGMIGAVAVFFFVKGEASAPVFGWLLVGGSLLYLLAGWGIASVEEVESEGEDGENGDGLGKRLAMLWEDRRLRLFVAVRTLLLGSALAAPYLVVLSQREGFELRSLAAFVVASGLASALSSVAWGRLSDRSSRASMAVGGASVAVVGLLGIGVALWYPRLAAMMWTWPVLFFLMKIGYSGVRIGRKTYVVDAAEGDRRTDYVSASNTVIAVMVLIFGAAGAGMAALGAEWALGFFTLMCVVGSLGAMRLEKV